MVSMTKETTNDGGVDLDDGRDLDEIAYSRLMNAARSAREQFKDVNINTSSPRKENLKGQMQAHGMRFVDGTWYVGDDKVDLLPVQTSESDSTSPPNEPKDKTILYCLTRVESSPDRIERIREALEEIGLELREAGDEGDNYRIVLPAENDPAQAHLFEEDGEQTELGKASSEEDEIRELREKVEQLENKVGS